MAILFDILVELQKQVQALDLPGIPLGNVVLCQVPAVEIARMNSQQLPAVVIAPFGAETVAPQSNLKDDVVYPVLVAIVTSTKIVGENVNEKQLADFDQRLTWRQTIRQAFSSQRLTQSLVHQISVQPLQIIDPTAYARDLYVSGFLLRLTNREGRT
jgi:hypothetical protein